MIASVTEFLSWMGVACSTPSEVPVQDVVVDSRQAGAGSVFFALDGAQVDGHHFVAGALERGAVLAVIRKGHEEAGRWLADARVVAVDDPVVALQHAARAYRKTFDVPVIAITGSNGKTTTKEMAAAVLGERYRLCYTSGNYNNHLGLPLSILSWTEDMEMAILEMGTNHFGEIRLLCDIARPTHGVITNIGKGHLEFFRDLEGVARAKGELLESMDDNGRAFLNGDDPHLIRRADVVSQTVTYGFSEDCDLRGEALPPDAEGHPGLRIEKEIIRVPLLGRHNLMNALAAVAVGRSLHVGWDQIRHAFQIFQPVKQRSQVQHAGGVTVINDAYNANPSSMAEALVALSEIPGPGRRVAVLGDMAEMGAASHDEHRLLGALVHRLELDALFSFGPEMHRAHERAAALGVPVTMHFDSAQSLIEQVKTCLESGDAVLVKGSRSMAMERVAEALIQHFSS